MAILLLSILIFSGSTLADKNCLNLHHSIIQDKTLDFSKANISFNNDPDIKERKLCFCYSRCLFLNCDLFAYNEAMSSCFTVNLSPTLNVQTFFKNNGSSGYNGSGSWSNATRVYSNYSLVECTDSCFNSTSCDYISWDGKRCFLFTLLNEVGTILYFIDSSASVGNNSRTLPIDPISGTPLLSADQSKSSNILLIIGMTLGLGIPITALVFLIFTKYMKKKKPEIKETGTGPDVKLGIFGSISRWKEDRFISM